jgi:hypothetical protein
MWERTLGNQIVDDGRCIAFLRGHIYTVRRIGPDVSALPH